MHCLNCGWNNPIGATICEKCQQPLPVSQEEPVAPAQPASRPTVTFQQPPSSYDASVGQKTVPQGQPYQTPPAGSTQREDNPAQTEQNPKIYKILFFIIMPLAVLFFMLTLVYYKLYRDTYEQSEQFREYYVDEQDKYETLEKYIDELHETQPFIITDILMGNETYNGNLISGYGKKIYSNQSQYLCARIKYKPVISTSYENVNAGFNANLKFKLYRPSGSLATGSSSPKGYTTDDTVEISLKPKEGYVDTFGWGGKLSGGFWPAGAYKFEVYYKDRCIGVKSFSIY